MRFVAIASQLPGGVAKCNGTGMVARNAVAQKAWGAVPPRWICVTCNEAFDDFAANDHNAKTGQGVIDRFVGSVGFRQASAESTA